MPRAPFRPRHLAAALRTLFAAFTLCASLLAAATPALSQQGPIEGRSGTTPIIVGDDEVIKIDTELVLVDVTVTDAEGRFVRGLRADDFKLYDDGEERPLAFFNVARRGGVERPVAVVFAVDVSGSMTPQEMERLKGALGAFAEKLSDRTALFALMSFGMSAKVHQSFTSDTRKLVRSAERLAREPSGLSTHTFDAIDDAIRLLTKHAPRTRDRRLVKRAVVVVTDGFPVGDRVKPETVIERANEAGVSVYTVTLPSFSNLSGSNGRAPLPTPLDVSGVTERTGGLSVYATDGDFEPLFRAIAEDVVSTYVLAFYPPEEKRRDGRFHTLRVEGPRGLFVRQNRDGYKSDER